MVLSIVMLYGLAFLKSRSMQVCLVVGLYLMCAPFLSMEMHQGLYTISLLIKDVLLWMLPITVSLFIAYAISSFEKQAPLFILFLFLFEAVSNSLSIWYAFGCGHVAGMYLPASAPEILNSAFGPLWRLPLTRPAWWGADKGTFVGIFLGLLAILKLPYLRQGIAVGKGVAEKILTKLFSRLIPLFVLGFVAKMYKTRLFDQMFTQYADVLLGLVLSLAVYMALLFWVGSGFSLPIFFRHVKNLLPAAGIAFSSGCSLSTMPWTIQGTSKNLKNPDLAQAVIPATTNIQQIGDCIANAFLCFLIYLHFNGHPPPLSIWLPFSAVFVLARFATAAIIGGAIFIMLPIYETYLHFTPEMIAIILAFNVILDPIITCSNVMANGALCRIFERAWCAVFPQIHPTRNTP
ncbi:MAG: cation:dicarboxylase symporter family transporter [Verrucomicrobia bacterium]|nr:cation:dicarboxylase symporter family transporter [Verrucomicrobiota bacterium]MBU6446297.1 cation:dicarboxylase symporter family transporter [Verrucomicrobiota bacterium]MDE3047192.1 cation:dicarboxylase symporter family transporter [Verrucomicrobiota bacterium]